MTFEELSRLAKEAGFTAWAPLDAATIELKSEVRDMCAANACGQYGKNWSCPPPRLRDTGGLRAEPGGHPRRLPGPHAG